jgi:hypothetical protein
MQELTAPHQTAPMTDKQRLKFLKQEYLQLQQTIEGFDGRVLTIKAWSVTFSMMAPVGAFAAHAPPALLIAVFGSRLFWWIECMWKTSQYASYRRLSVLEDYFAGKGEPPAPFQIGRSWYERWSSLGVRRMFRILFWPRVALPHAAVALLGSPLYVLALADVVKT